MSAMDLLAGWKSAILLILPDRMAPPICPQYLAHPLLYLAELLEIDPAQLLLQRPTELAEGRMLKGE